MSLVEIVVQGGLSSNALMTRQLCKNFGRRAVTPIEAYLLFQCCQRMRILEVTFVQALRHLLSCY